MKLKAQIDFEGYVKGKQTNIHIELIDISVEELTEIIRALEIATKAEQEAEAPH